jgi:hypothetical protein
MAAAHTKRSCACRLQARPPLLCLTRLLNSHHTLTCCQLHTLCLLQDFLKARGIVVDRTTVIQQAAVTQLSDNNSEQSKHHSSCR